MLQKKDEGFRGDFTLQSISVFHSIPCLKRPSNCPKQAFFRRLLSYKLAAQAVSRCVLLSVPSKNLVSGKTSSVPSAVTAFALKWIISARQLLTSVLPSLLVKFSWLFSWIRVHLFWIRDHAQMGQRWGFQADPAQPSVISFCTASDSTSFAAGIILALAVCSHNWVREAKAVPRPRT